MAVPLVARVLVADDHALVRTGLKHVIDAADDLRVVAEAGNGAEAVDRVTRADDIDLAILDVSMPRMTGLQATAEIVRRAPRTRVLILSMHDSEQFLVEAFRAGARGYVLKSTADVGIVDACRAVLRGESFVYPDAMASLVQHVVESGGAVDRLDVLTPRELEIVKLIAEAHNSRQIAEALVISPKTVDRHRQNILDKLGMSDRVELTRYAIRRGLIQP